MKSISTIIGCLSSTLVLSSCAYSATAGTKPIPVKVAAPALCTQPWSIPVSIPVNATLGSVYTDKPLTGLKGAYICVEKINAEAQKDGLDPDQLKVAVELSLREAGITVFDKVDSNGNDSMAGLDVVVDTLKEDNGFYAFSAHLDLTEVVRQIRPTERRTAATTWTTSQFGTVGANNMATVLRQSVKDAADRFANDYLAQNPK